MIRFLRLLFLAFVLGGLIAFAFHSENGYMLLRYGHYELETSLVFFVIGLILAALIIYLAVRLIAAGWGLPSRLGGWRRRRREARARRSLISGLLALWEGRWSNAETELARDAEKAESPVVNYLAAARAAHVQRAYDRRDDYLRRAYRAESGPAVATLLSQARLEMEQGQYARAQATLKRLGQVAVSHPYALTLRVALYRHLQDWERLRALLPDLSRAGALTGEERRELTREVYARLLDARTAREDLSSLRGIWEKMPSSLQQNAGLLHTYARLLAGFGEQAQAADLAAKYLKKEWDPDLAVLYGQLEAGDVRQQLSAAEEWLKRYGEKPELLLMAGTLCLRNRLWGRARSYLEQSIAARPTPQAYQALGDLCSQVGEQEAALKAYRNGMRLVIPEIGTGGQARVGQVTKA